MYIWSWDGYVDAGQNFSCFTTSQIENNNEFAWSNKEFDRLDEVQMTSLDPDQRAEVVKQQQEVMYEDCPCIVLSHPYKLAAYRTDKWTGWQRAGYGTGPAFFAGAIPYLYQNVEPKTATASGGGVSSTWIVVIVGIAIAAAVVALLLVLRGRRRRAEEV
jgi:peptide/nickel transport system substrate-binding protein